MTVVSAGELPITGPDGNAFDFSDLQPGHILNLTWDGLIAESYPAQIHHVEAISVTGKQPEGWVNPIDSDPFFDSWRNAAASNPFYSGIPTLQVSFRTESESSGIAGAVNAAQGTASWYENGEGICVDSPHPLDWEADRIPVIPHTVTVSALDGSLTVASRYFDDKIYAHLLASADQNGDRKLNQYELSLVTELDLSGMELTSLKGLAKLPNLSWVDASDNNLRSLASVGRCGNLLYLDVSRNELNSLTGVSSLRALVELNAAGNDISSISALSGCSEMKHLDLSRNSISTISSLSRLPGLTTLVLDSNRISRIPDLPRSLSILSIRDNQLSSMNFVTTLRSLETLDLSGIHD